MANYPEHEKLAKVRSESQTIGEFLEWLGHREDLMLCRPHPENGLLWLPREQSSEELLAEFFEVDLKKLEEEKKAMLKEITSHTQV